jgi:hypothetical protein
VVLYNAGSMFLQHEFDDGTTTVRRGYNWGSRSLQRGFEVSYNGSSTLIQRGFEISVARLWAALVGSAGV